MFQGDPVLFFGFLYSDNSLYTLQLKQLLPAWHTKITTVNISIGFN